jgi:iron(III) transport system substrate-binding protein
LRVGLRANRRANQEEPTLSRCLGIVVGLSFAVILACGAPVEPSAGQTERARRVVVFSPHGQELLDEFIELFEAEYPDISVVGTFVPTGKILSRLRIDKDSPQTDIWWGGTSAFFAEAKAEGLLQAYRPTWADQVNAGFHDPDDMWYAHFLQVPAIMFNRNIYQSAQMPKRWSDLLAPEWNDKIVIREPMHSGTMKTIFTGIIWQLGGPAHAPEAGYAYLKRLDAQTRSYLPNPQALYDRIARSSAGYISMWNLTDILYQSEANGYPFGFHLMDEPAAVSLDPIGIVAGAPNPEEAKLFYEFVTSKESCIRLARNHFRILAREDIPKEDLPLSIASVEFTPLDIELKTFDRLQIDWMQHWADSIRSPEK